MELVNNILLFMIEYKIIKIIDPSCKQFEARYESLPKEFVELFVKCHL